MGDFKYSSASFSMRREDAPLLEIEEFSYNDKFKYRIAGFGKAYVVEFISIETPPDDYDVAAVMGIIRVMPKSRDHLEMMLSYE